MAWTRVTEPTDPVATDTDWTYMKGWVLKSLLQSNGYLIVKDASGNIPQGSLAYIGGTLYYNDADLLPSGTASAYIQITPSGATATAAFVSSLSGVSWNSTYCGWYDGSGDLYVFDEGYALAQGEISAIHSRYVDRSYDGKASLPGGLLGNLSIGGNLSVTGSISGRLYNGSLHSASLTGGDIYSALVSILSDGESMVVSGMIWETATGDEYIISMASLIGSTIYIYGWEPGGGLSSLPYTSGDSTSWRASIAW